MSDSETKDSGWKEAMYSSSVPLMEKDISGKFSEPNEEENEEESLPVFQTQLPSNPISKLLFWPVGKCLFLFFYNSTQRSDMF